MKTKTILNSQVIVLLALLLIMAASCKKDRLDGAYNRLVGEWEWLWTAGGVTSSFDTPDSAGFTITLIFEERGIYKIDKNNERLERGRLNIVNSEPYSLIDFVIELKPQSEYFFMSQQQVYFWSDDSLVLRDDLCADCFSRGFVRK
ncbi:MAG: hypothetical protein IIA45_05055 [Bacteroidetes bacterium]|nr:hypothetical protein [Bacteroidota bacterium]